MQERDNNLSAAVCSMRAVDADRLISSGDGDGALLYIYLLRRGAGPEAELCRALGWTAERLRAAAARLRSLGLVSGGTVPEGSGDLPEYTAEDIVRRSREDADFRCILAEAERLLGHTLSTQETKTLFGVYDFVGLPTDVMLVLLHYCLDEARRRYGPGRRPGMKQIEKEGYAWARMGIDTQAAADAYLRTYAQRQGVLPQYMKALQLGDRPPAPSEEKYILAWQEMGFGPEAVALAYDKTVLKCHELKWAYCNGILKKWNEAGLHTVEEIQAGDRPAARRGDQQSPRDTETEMRRYMQELHRNRR